MQFITWADYVLLPIYLAIIFAIAKSVKNSLYPEGHPWRPYFMPGLAVKVAGAIFIGLLYQYYYKGGDTANYFVQSRVLNEAFLDSPFKWLQLVFHIPASYDGWVIDYTSRIEWYDAVNNYAVVAIAGVVGIFTFNTFLPSSLLFAVISFTGIWAMFRAFSSQYPALIKHIALVILFIPSTFIWGSGIFKDTICMFGMGWMIYGTFRLLIQRRIQPISIAMTVIGFYLVAVIKIYILISFLPALGLWILFSYSQKIKLSFVRIIMKVGLFAGSAALFVSFSSTFSSELGRYSLENLATTATVTRDYIYISSGDEGSAYNLGEFDPSITGMLKQFLPAVNVTLFRPYIWESRKPIVLFNALEAFLFLFFTLKLLVTLGPGKIWVAINKDPNIQFCLIFTLVFAFAVGISSANFGTLSRYRIPCLPLYGLALVLIYYQYNDPAKPFLRIRR